MSIKKEDLQKLLNEDPLYSYLTKQIRINDQEIMSNKKILAALNRKQRELKRGKTALVGLRADVAFRLRRKAETKKENT